MWRPFGSGLPRGLGIRRSDELSLLPDVRLCWVDVSTVASRLPLGVWLYGLRGRAASSRDVPCRGPAVVNSLLSLEVDLEVRCSNNLSLLSGVRLRWMIGSIVVSLLFLGVLLCGLGVRVAS